ncbi:unnamed protein product [Clonostachys solani]|uniref:Uncharacterized protein n=1 Tax=Clonostachys solani TaxID=160281 RepID=A0A9P0EP40_9HYPO|nr:unnamed protein product [Clonostachys solani]
MQIPAPDQLATRITEAPGILFEPLVILAFAAKSVEEATLTHIELGIVAFLVVDIGPKDRIITDVAFEADVQQWPFFEVLSILFDIIVRRNENESRSGAQITSG